MWQKLLDLAKLVWTFGEETRQNSEDIKGLEEESRRVVSAIHQLFFELERVRDEIRQLRTEIEHLKETERHEREKLILQFQNELLRRQLPPPEPDDQN